MAPLAVPLGSAPSATSALASHTLLSGHWGPRLEEPGQVVVGHAGLAETGYQLAVRAVLAEALLARQGLQGGLVLNRGA